MYGYFRSTSMLLLVAPLETSIMLFKFILKKKNAWSFCIWQWNQSCLVHIILAWKLANQRKLLIMDLRLLPCLLSTLCFFVCLLYAMIGENKSEVVELLHRRELPLDALCVKMSARHTERPYLSRPNYGNAHWRFFPCDECCSDFPKNELCHCSRRFLINPSKQEQFF